MPDKDYITVSQLNYFINNMFLSEELLHNVPVVGEVSGCNIVNNNCYFTLKDDKAQIKIVYFRCDKRYVPSNGERVLVRGMVDYYQTNGTVSVKAYEITRFGIGDIHARLQELKEKLTEEGLFDEKHKKSLPIMPKNIAVITSVKGAALQDILYTFGKHNSKQSISVIDVRVQGEYCVGDVCTALTYADAYGFDVIILARGGGSFEDLYPFNDEQIIRTIYAMKTPIITAVGHETDYTLCDFVSDYRAITPTAAAEKVAIDILEEKKRIKDLTEELRELVHDHFVSEKNRIMIATKRIASNANQTILLEQNNIKNKAHLCKIYAENIFRQKSNNYSEKLSILDNLNPTKLLKKGYFRIIYNNDTINSLSKVKVNSEIEIIGEKQKVKAIVVKKEKL